MATRYIKEEATYVFILAAMYCIRIQQINDCKTKRFHTNIDPRKPAK